MNIEEAVLATISQLIGASEINPEKLDIAGAVGEAGINGTEYQIQIHFVTDKKIWLKES